MLASFQPRCVSHARSSRSCPATSRHVHAASRVSRTSCKAAAPLVELPVANGDAQLLQNYAVLSIGGIQQLVQEGNWYCCSDDALPQASGGDNDGKLLFDRVLAWKNNGRFVRGRPFLKDVVVEAQVLEEFTAPCNCSSKDEQSTAARPQVVMKYLVTKITSQQ